MLKATNVRLGFATNSSSAHSVVLGPGRYSSEPVGETRVDGYGWEDFTLDTVGERVSYLATAVHQSLSGEPDYVRHAVMRELFPGIDLSAEGDRYGYVGIDHQSAFALGDWKSPAFPGLMREALEFFTDQRVSIHGGNDNDDSGYQGPYSLAWFGEYEPIRVRRDGDGYVLFHRSTGAKVRLAPEGQQFVKASRPELVDVKITDFCAAGCAFCYQSSTREGVVGDARQVDAVIDALGIDHLGVFEVAIGGGEPTAVDHFSSTVRRCCDRGIRPNFTTFAVEWLLDDAKRAAAAMCGGIGVSVHSAKQLWRWTKIRDAMPKAVQVMAQHVYGTLDAKATMALLRECRSANVPLLLLGYKPVGFGSTQRPHDMSAVEAELGRPYVQLLPSRLSVDTAFVNQHPGFLSRIKAENVSLTRTEGAFSCYIDAVTSQMGPSSYCAPEEMTRITIPGDYKPDVTSLADQVLATFRQYPADQ